MTTSQLIMSKVLFIRHGKCLSHTLKDDEKMLSDEENCLTLAGRTKVEELAAQLKNRFQGKKVLIASPVTRAEETGKIFADELIIPCTLEKRLRERKICIPDGMTIAEFRSYQEQSYLDPDHLFNNSETIREHRKRCAEWLDAFQQTMKNDTTYFIITHGGTIEHLHALLFHSDFRAMTSTHTSCDPAHYHEWSIFTLKDGRTVWRLDGVNLSQ